MRRHPPAAPSYSHRRGRGGAGPPSLSQTTKGTPLSSPPPPPSPTPAPPSPRARRPRTAVTTCVAWSPGYRPKYLPAAFPRHPDNPTHESVFAGLRVPPRVYPASRRASWTLSFLIYETELQMQSLLACYKNKGTEGISRLYEGRECPPDFLKGFTRLYVDRVDR